MNITEANAVINVLARFGVLKPAFDGDVSNDRAENAIGLLAARAGRALNMTFTPHDDLDDWLHAVDSDGAAQNVCRAIADHYAHGGTIPWPSISRPFNEWRAIRDGHPSTVETPR